MNSNTKEKYFEIIKNYQTKLNDFNQQLNETPFECVFNNQLLEDNIFEQEIKGIIVMDNPGQEEKLQCKYLVGTAGKAFNKVLNSIGLIRKNVLVLNKSSITTPATNDLNSIYEDEKTKQIFLKEQKETFETIKKISLELKIPLMIHGYASYLKKGKTYTDNEKGNRPLYLFFKELQTCEELHGFSYFYKHSSYGNLSKQISAYTKELNISTLTFEQYLDLGKKNINGFFN